MKSAIITGFAGVWAIAIPSLALAQSGGGGTGPGMPVLVGESRSVDFNEKTMDERARDAAERDALQKQQKGKDEARSLRARPARLKDLVEGAKIFDKKGVEIGTIQSVDGNSAVVASGDSVVAVPADAFGKNRNGLMLAMTKAQFDKLVAGAQ
ncbi:hypothetical protein GCM10023219_00570 [Stakelama sediminis]|uniref:PRC-barrel domain-containing protein n=1 Tax=Stakelama sediminis TaxID=463200 RepID=A0A840Z1B1_9SPHN|nr:hypothetical protein [Stakelama sediminis]MBB5719506.1 hypothetical protein [Stakelama sediminis]